MKKKIVVKGPALSASGYGEQARFALRSLRQQEDSLEIFLININWGRTGQAPLSSDEKAWLEHLITKTQVYAKQNNNKLHFDMSLQITIPNEFEKMADVNIGYTAGIETTKAAHQWIEKCNMMDKIIVPSNHSKNVLEQTAYKAKREGSEETFDFKLTTPVEVCAFPASESSFVIPELNLESEWNFLSVAQWGPRKNVEATVRNFLEEFKNEEDVGLILKVNVAKNSMMDKLATQNRLRQVVEQVKAKIGDYKCKLYLLHGSLSDEEMRGLYRHPKIKAFVTTTHGEGFGLPMFDAAIAGLPIAAPAWSSYVDFLYAPKKDKQSGKTKNQPHFVRIDYELKPVQKEAVWDGVIVADSQWCWVKDHSVRNAMRELRKNHGPHLSDAKKVSAHILEEFNEAKQIELFSSFIYKKQVLIAEEINGISFCIPTNGKRIDKTLKTIESIKRQKWNNLQYEIIICGDVQPFKHIENIKLIDKTLEANDKKVSLLRNKAAEFSKFDNIVFCDDDIVLNLDWLEKTVEYSKNNGWQILGNRILNPDGTRHWDKALMNPRSLVEYRHSDDDSNLMQTSGFFLIRKEVYSQNKWDETKYVYADRERKGIPEDVQFNIDFRRKGFTLAFNASAIVWHNDDSYTEIMNQTLKKETINQIYKDFNFSENCLDFQNLVGDL